MEKIQKIIRQLGREVQGLIDSCVELSWYMRGGITYDQLLLVSAAERDRFLNFINKRMENLHKMGNNPVY